MRLHLLYPNLKILFAVFFTISVWHIAGSQSTNGATLATKWTAQWLMPPDNPNGYGVYHYRRTFHLQTVPGMCYVNVSGDNRYELFVNGVRVCYGPARGDLNHWPYETVDIAPYLKKGKNVIAAINWNYGAMKHVAQISYKTGFILQAPMAYDSLMSTHYQKWLMYKNEAITPYRKNVPFGVTGVEDNIDGNLYPWGWETTDYDDTNWAKVTYQPDGGGYPKGYPVPFNGWALVPRTIPFMQDSLLTTFVIKRVKGFSNTSKNLKNITIPAHSKVSLLLDHTVLTNAYPMLQISGGKGAQMELVYAECLMDSAKAYGSDDFAVAKNNRNTVANLKAIGIADRFIADGGSKRTYRPLWFRNFRYIEIEIETASEPLVIDKIEALFTGYPLVEKAKFYSDKPQLSKIWQAGYRTARLCAHETYFDCPYYEQLQYIGDTRIQAIISYYVSGDDRLAKNAISQFVQSQTYEGLTRSSWPNNGLQYIPPFSLFWALMLHDLYWYRGDTTVVKEYIPNMLRVFDWHNQFIGEQGVLKNVPYWNFVDWPNEWKWDNKVGYGGIPEGGLGGVSAIVNLQYAYTLQKTAELLTRFGYEPLAQKNILLANHLIENIKKICLNPETGLLSDAPGSDKFSQHANLWLVLCNVIPKENQAEFMMKLLNDTSLIKCTVYYKYYLLQALKHADLGNLYLNNINEWSEMLDMGLTTFAERPEPTRSDCHAWSAHPLIDLLATVLGVEPAAPGFRKVKIAPQAGSFTRLSGQVPTPYGWIKVNLNKSKSKWKGTVVLPEECVGTLLLNNVETALNTGINVIK